MTCAHEMLVPIFDPAYRPANAAREKGDEEVFRINVTLQAKSPTDVQREAAHTRFRHPQHARRFSADPVNDLSRTPDRDGICSRLVQGDHAAAFHWCGRVAVRVETPLQTMRCAGKRAL